MSRKNPNAWHDSVPPIPETWRERNERRRALTAAVLRGAEAEGLDLRDPKQVSAVIKAVEGALGFPLSPNARAAAAEVVSIAHLGAQ